MEAFSLEIGPVMVGKAERRLIGTPKRGLPKAHAFLLQAAYPRATADAAPQLITQHRYWSDSFGLALVLTLGERRGRQSSCKPRRKREPTPTGAIDLVTREIVAYGCRVSSFVGHGGWRGGAFR